MNNIDKKIKICNEGETFPINGYLSRVTGIPVTLDLSQASTEDLKKELEKRGESVGLSNKEKNAYLEKLKGYVKEMNDAEGEISDSTVHSLADEMMVEILKKSGGFDEFVELYNDIPRYFE